MAIIWDSPHERRAAAQAATEVAWRMFLVQTLTGLTTNAEEQVKAAEQRRGRLSEREELEPRAA